MSELDCKNWLKNPLFDPITKNKIIEKKDFTKWAIATLVQVNPSEIYDISKKMFHVLGLDDIFEPTED